MFNFASCHFSLDDPGIPAAHSDTHLNDPDRCNFIRRRFKSLGDVTSNSKSVKTIGLFYPSKPCHYCPVNSIQ